MATTPEALRTFATRAEAEWGFAPDAALLGAWVGQCATGPLDRLDPGVALACGLFHQHPLALGCFERRVAPKVRAALRKLGATEAEADEHLQATRTKLLVDDGGARLKSYRGLGSFDAFATTAAVRAWYSAHQKAKPAAEDDALAKLPAAVDLERALARTGQQAHFAEAFRQALAELSPRERALLRLNLVDGASVDELAPMYAVSRATVARWLSAARTALQGRTVRALAQRTKLGGTELDGLMASLESGFDLSLRRFVAEAAGGDE